MNNPIPPISYRKRLFAKVVTTFNPHSFTLYWLHVVEITQTALMHADQWSNLHVTIAIALVAKVIKFAKI